jgi:hypothetical protein
MAFGRCMLPWDSSSSVRGMPYPGSSATDFVSSTSPNSGRRPGVLLDTLPRGDATGLFLVRRESGELRLPTVGFEPDGVRERPCRLVPSPVLASGDTSNWRRRSLIRPLRALAAVASTGADLALLSGVACTFAGPDSDRFEERPAAAVAVEEDEEVVEGLAAVPFTLDCLRLAGAAITPSSVCRTMSGCEVRSAKGR